MMKLWCRDTGTRALELHRIRARLVNVIRISVPELHSLLSRHDTTTLTMNSQCNAWAWCSDRSAYTLGSDNSSKQALIRKSYTYSSYKANQAAES
jgi:hypothetical protein